MNAGEKAAEKKAAVEKAVAEKAATETADAWKRDELWKAVFFEYYYTFYDEILAEELTAKWYNIDALATVTIAVTTSSSAVAGWALWKQPEWRTLWACFAGAGALLSIVHSRLQVSHKLKEYGQAKSHLMKLRLEWEELRHKMSINFTFPVQTIDATYLKLKHRFGDASLKGPDLLLTRKLRFSTQERLNEFLKNEIKPCNDECPSTRMAGPAETDTPAGGTA